VAGGVKEYHPHNRKGQVVGRKMVRKEKGRLCWEDGAEEEKQKTVDANLQQGGTQGRGKRD